MQISVIADWDKQLVALNLQSGAIKQRKKDTARKLDMVKEAQSDLQLWRRGLRFVVAVFVAALCVVHISQCYAHADSAP